MGIWSEGDTRRGCKHLHIYLGNTQDRTTVITGTFVNTIAIRCNLVVMFRQYI